MCHSFETYDPKIALREVEERLAAPSPRLGRASAAIRDRLRGWIDELRAGSRGGPRGKEALE